MLTVFIFPLRLFATNRAPQNPSLPFIPNQPTNRTAPSPDNCFHRRAGENVNALVARGIQSGSLRFCTHQNLKCQTDIVQCTFGIFLTVIFGWGSFFLYRLTPFLVSMRIKFFWIPKQSSVNSERIYFYWWDRCRLFPFLLIYPNFIHYTLYILLYIHYTIFTY